MTSHVLLGALIAATMAAEQPDVKTIIEKSVAANDSDFKAEPQFNHKERDRKKTSQVTMIDGSPYERVLTENGRPLSGERADEEMKKQQKAEAERKAQTSEQREARIADYNKDRSHDHEMMAQLPAAFDFTLVGRRKIRGFQTWVLKATPKPGYKPPNMEAQVLPGMEGEISIDQKTYEWVKVTAKVIHPVSIAGFLAQVQPGTRFEVDRGPVGGGIWQITHFSMQSHAKVLFLVNKNSAEEIWFYDFERAAAAKRGTE